MLLQLLLVTAGCGPLIPPDQALAVASDIGLSPELTCDQLKFSFGVPQLTTVADPSGIGLAFEETHVTTAAGATLRVWYIPAPAERGTILLAYGAVGEMACYLLLAEHLVPSGWSLVMYDFQGFGGSSGRPTITSLMADHDAVFDWTLARTGRSQVTLMGISIGTIPSIAQAARRPEAVNAVILDGVISLRSQLERFQYLIGGRVQEYLDLFGPELDLETQITQVHRPILALVYGLDGWTRPERIRRILATAPGDVTIFEFPQLRHARGPYLAPDTFFAELEQFLTRVWTAP
jgi:pimeloyl-ACP methyl ester carboxylesterase